MAAVDGGAPRSYGNWRRPASAGILGLGSIGTGLLIGGLIFVVLMVMLSGLLEGFITFVLVAIALGAVTVRDKHGRNLIDRGMTLFGWQSARSKGAHLYRSGPLGFALWGTNQLPGIAASLRLSEHHDSYGRPFTLVHSPTTNSYAVVIETEPDGASLVDQEQVDVWVADWGHWLAGLADEPGVEAASVTIETAPDTGTRLRREVSASLDPQAPPFARQMLADVVESAPSGSSVIKGYVTVTFSAAARTGSKRRSPDEIGRDLAARLPGLTGDLSATGAGTARPLSSGELCEVIRTAFDPTAAGLIDSAHAEGETTDLSWADVGPSSAEASWGGYAHDGAYSVTWQMSAAPRGNVQSNILARLLAPHRDVDRKRITLLYRPIDAARAAAIVEADLRAAQFRQTSSGKPTARDVLATRSASSTASEEASGAALVNFGMLVTATVSDRDRAGEAVAAIDNLSATARLRLRPVYGSQDSAFVAALPLGLVLPKHLKVPATVRERL